MSQFTFREIARGEFIDRCGAMLPNKMRCHKPGKHVVLSDSESKNFKPYQVCQMHMVVMSRLGTTTGPIMGIEGTGTVAKQEIPQKELTPKTQTEDNGIDKEKREKKDEQSSGPKS